MTMRGDEEEDVVIVKITVFREMWRGERRS